MCGYQKNRHRSDCRFFLQTEPSLLLTAFGGVTIWGLIPVDTGVLDDNGSPIMAPQNLAVGAIAGAGFALFTLLEAVDAYYSAERHNQLLRIRLGIEQFDPMMIHTFGR